MDFDKLEELKSRIGLESMSRPMLIGVAVILVVVAAAAGMRLTGTATADEFEVTKDAQEQQSGDDGQSAQSTVFVHVSGAVSSPGLYELDAGSRVADAINAAGGFSDDAANSSINLARILEDGEQVIVAAQGEPGGEGLAQESGGSANPSAAAASSGGLVNINTAAAVDLVSLPGIGEATAAKIIADRDANGPYKTIEDLKRVSGIGDKKFEALSGLICV